MQITRYNLTPDLFIELYRKHKLLPCPFQMFAQLHLNRCCGMGLLALEVGAASRSSIPSDTSEANNALATLLGDNEQHDFIAAFKSGFDSGILGSGVFQPFRSTPGYMIGYNVGRHCASLWKGVYPW